MPATYIVPELGTDFTQDFEDLLIAYIFSKWGITAPQKGSSVTHADAVIHFRPGFPSWRKPFEVLALQTTTEVMEVLEHQRMWLQKTTVEVTLTAMRIQKDNIDSDPDTVGNLGNMERELQRIVRQYITDTGKITGIMQLTFDGGSRVYEPGDNFAKSNWKSVWRVGMMYAKYNNMTMA